MARIIRHWAICTDTAEVLGASTSNALKRSVKLNTEYDRNRGFQRKNWKFFHGTEQQFRKHYSSLS